MIYTKEFYKNQCLEYMTRIREKAKEFYDSMIFYTDPDRIGFFGEEIKPKGALSHFNKEYKVI